MFFWRKNKNFQKVQCTLKTIAYIYRVLKDNFIGGRRMSNEIEELSLELEFENDVVYEFEYSREDMESTMIKKTDVGEEEVNVGEIINPNFITNLSLTSSMSEEQLSSSILSALGNEDFTDLEVEIAFSDGTEVEFKIENEDEDEDEDEDDVLETFDEEDEDEDEDED